MVNYRYLIVEDSVQHSDQWCSTLLAVSNLGPHIEEVFPGPSCRFQSGTESISYWSFERIIQTLSIVSLFSNLHFRIYFFIIYSEKWMHWDSPCVDPQLMIKILDIIGPNFEKLVLTSTTYHFYHKIDMGYLASICINLEHLTFHDSARIIMHLKKLVDGLRRHFFQS